MEGYIENFIRDFADEIVNDFQKKQDLLIGRVC